MCQRSFRELLLSEACDLPGGVIIGEVVGRESDGELEAVVNFDKSKVECYAQNVAKGTL